MFIIQSFLEFCTNRGLQIDDFPTVWLLEYHIRFSLCNGLALVVNCKGIVHCTTKKRFVSTFGIAFVMKRNFITQMKRALNNPQADVTINYFKAKAKYKEGKVITISYRNLFYHFHSILIPIRVDFLKFSNKFM